MFVRIVNDNAQDCLLSDLIVVSDIDNEHLGMISISPKMPKSVFKNITIAVIIQRLESVAATTAEKK